MVYGEHLAPRAAGCSPQYMSDSCLVSTLMLKNSNLENLIGVRTENQVMFFKGLVLDCLHNYL